MSSPIVLLLVKVSLLLSAALAAAWMTRRAPARSRHGLWSGVFAAVLLLPLMTAAIPALRVPVPEWATRGAASVQVSRLPLDEVRTEIAAPADEKPAADAETIRDLTPAPATVARPSRFGLSAAQVVALVWLAGALAAIGTLAIALVRVARLCRTATPITDGDWTAAAASIAERLARRSPVRLLTSPRVTTPMAGGVMRPTIFLPSTAFEWTAEQREVVLTHEMAHLAGRDPLRQLVSRVALSIYWFHPLAWIAARQSAIAREQACDETVIALGTRPSTYARVLLEFADGAPRASGPLAALPIVQRSTLEKRLMAILNDEARPATRRVALVFAALAALTLSVAAAHPAEQEVIADGAGQTLNISGVAGDVKTGVPITAPDLAGVAGGVVRGVKAGMSAPPQRANAVCDWSHSGVFHGSMSSSRGNIIQERAGRRNSDLLVQSTFDDIRVCAFVEGINSDDWPSPRDWARLGTRVVLETEESNGPVRRVEIQQGRMAFFVNGQSRPLDDTARRWADRVSDLIDVVWELRQLRGQESSLRGQISSIRGQRSSLQGQISSLRGQVSSMRGEISSWQGRESSLRGEISSLQGQVSSMEGRISSEQGAISSLQARRWNASEQERVSIENQITARRARIAEIEKEIAKFDVEARIREVEKRIAQTNVDARVAEVEKRLREFDVEARVREVEQQIARLEVDKRVQEYEREIAGLDVERRARELEARVETALKRLREIR